jgi:hypothetical protein
MFIGPLRGNQFFKFALALLTDEFVKDHRDLLIKMSMFFGTNVDRLKMSTAVCKQWVLSHRCQGLFSLEPVSVRRLPQPLERAGARAVRGS